MTFCRWDLEYTVYWRKHKIYILWNFGILGHFLRNFRSWQKDYWYLRNKTSTSCVELNKKVMENKTCTLFSIFVKTHQFTGCWDSSPEGIQIMLSPYCVIQYSINFLMVPSLSFKGNKTSLYDFHCTQRCFDCYQKANSKEIF